MLPIKELQFSLTANALKVDNTLFNGWKVLFGMLHTVSVDLKVPQISATSLLDENLASPTQ